MLYMDSLGFEGPVNLSVYRLPIIT